jgi:hypothetical protein
VREPARQERFQSGERASRGALHAGERGADPQDVADRPIGGVPERLGSRLWVRGLVYGDEVAARDLVELATSTGGSRPEGALEAGPDRAPGEVVAGVSRCTSRAVETNGVMVASSHESSGQGTRVHESL